MAVLQSIQSGNFLDASTWGLVDTSSYLDSRVSEQGLTTTTTNSTTTFIPGAITVAGVAVQIGSRVATPLGTMTVRLFNTTAGTVVKDVVIDVADLPTTGGVLNGGLIGWTYFKFDTNVTLIAGNAYSVRVFVSVNSTVAVYRNATVNNWSRALVTATTQAPAVTDTLITSGAYTATGVNTSVIVTMNSVSTATQYGACYVGSNGNFNYGISPSTNYGLRINGDLIIGRGATFTIGTVANPMPATSTAVLEITCASALQFGIFNYGTLETKYETTVLHRALLAADIAIGATTMTTNVNTGWKLNDSIVIPSTTRTAAQHERRVLSANASGTTLTIPATTNAHDGNATIYMQADLVNLTRSIKIRSVSATFKTRFRQGRFGITTLFDVEFFELGASTHVSGSTTFEGTFNLQQCTFWQTGVPGTTTLFSGINTTSNTVSNNVFYVYSDIVGTLNDNNVIIGFTAFAAHSGGTLGNNNVISSCGQAGSSIPPLTGTTGNKFYATGGNGAIYVTSNSGTSTISNYVFFNNAVAVRYLSNNPTVGTDRTPLEKFEGCYFYGNTENISVIASSSLNMFRKLWFNNCFFWAGKTGLLTLIGYSALANDYTHFTNCTFGKRPDGVDSLFTTSCLRGGQAGNTFTNCLFSGTEASFASLTSFTSVNGFNGITSLKHDQITNEYRQYQSNGFIQNDNTITYNGLPTIRINPIVATNKTFSNSVRVAVQSGQTCNISVTIRKSITADGSASYNGNQPRLMYAFNPLAGNLTETVAAIPINQFQFPQEFNNAYWQKSAMTITPDVNFFSGSQPAPDGTFTADLFNEDNTTTRHRILLANTINVSSGTTYTLSVYAKKIAHDWIQLNPVYDTFFDINNWANFNLATGTIGNTGVGASASITSVGNGWYRLSLKCDVISSGATFLNLLLSTNNTDSGRYPSYTGTNANCFLIWGAQFTLGSTLLPYYDNGQFETLSYTTPAVNHDSVLEFYMDCDGTTGWINVDDFKTTTSNDTRSMNYWSTVGVYTEPDWRKPGGTVTFVT